jgi:hypothetical protein
MASSFDRLFLPVDADHKKATRSLFNGSRARHTASMAKGNSLLDRLRRKLGTTAESAEEKTPSGAAVAPVDTPLPGAAVSATATAQSAEEETRLAVLLVRGSLPIPEDTPAKSYLGGLPRMPAHFEWPVESFFDELRSLTFVAQIDLSELPEFPERGLLPAKGTLYFFVSSDFDGVGEPPCKVLYFEGDATALPVFPPPDNLMLLAGNLYYCSRFWLDENRDPRAKVEFKYPLSFVITESFPEEEGARQLDAWQAALGATSDHDLRKLHDILSPEDEAWPFNWASVEHIALALAIKIDREPDRLKSVPPEVAARLAEVVADARKWAMRAKEAESFTAPSSEHKQEFRSWWLAQRTWIDQTSRAHRLYHFEPERIFQHAAIHAVRLSCAAGAGAQALVPSHYLTSVQTETLWQRSTSTGDMWVNMPMHQMFGFAERVQNAPLDHVDDVLLLQIKGDTGLAWHDNIGCALQLWVSREALQALRLQEVQATLECD